MKWLLFILIYLPVPGHSDCPDYLDMPSYDYGWMTSVFEPNARVLAFLKEGDRRISPIQSPYGKLNAAIRYVHASLKWDAQNAAYPEPTFSLVLARGLGGCQHFAVLTAALLNRAGFSVRFVVVTPADETGHVWLELEINDKTYVVDPTTRVILSLFQTFRQRATRASVNSWYLNPQRLYYDIQ